MLNELSDKTKEAVSTMLDAFSGADGGLNFVSFISLLVAMEKQASEGDTAAIEIINRVVGVGKLIAYAGKGKQ